ncbi:MAG: hypothetical protein DHS20C13_00890 [Thermodesulfobacteriota bacterium]|nr:MAG: hypothetical protein DHS20C13_00890 [Thermodesulfobacteriota bacterium]
MNAIRFGLYAGIIWALASVLLIEISLMEGAATAWVELDFRFLSGIALVILHALDMETSLSGLIQYSQFGMPINAINSIIAIITGFIDGFVSGFFIAIFYNFLSIISEGKNFPTTIKFGIATGIVLAICSGLLALVSMLYNFEIDSFGFAIRPIYLTFQGISNITQITDASTIGAISKSYLMFPESYKGVFEWGLWGFVDGFIGGMILGFIFTRIKNFLRPRSIKV